MGESPQEPRSWAKEPHADKSRNDTQHITYQRTRAGSSLAGSRPQAGKALSCVDGDWLQTVPRSRRSRGGDLVKMP